MPSQTLTYSIVTNGTKGVATVNPLNTQMFTYTPNPNQSAIDTFTFKANDGLLDSAPGTITVTIIANRAPMALDGSASGNENTVVNGTFSVTDPDLPAQTFTYSIVTNGTKGVAAVIANTNTFTYMPNANRFGSDSFTFKANDGLADSAPATITVSIRPTTIDIGDVVLGAKIPNPPSGDIPAVFLINPHQYGHFCFVLGRTFDRRTNSRRGSQQEYSRSGWQRK